MDGNGNSHQYYEDDDDEVPLPGFRFHPTDEELVGFYLRRKLDKKPISIELIKLIDIYKYDPWDLPKVSSIVGEKEYYFFCRRGRKYKNSIRPNRVTGSGFWKATGIDKPVYSNGGEGQDCIGLKKTLVYYRGSAGKGSKTDWMMHEFRLPSPDIDAHLIKNNKPATATASATDTAAAAAAANIHLQEAEILTLCRIFKRNVSQRKNLGDWKQFSSKRTSDQKSSKSGCSTVDSNGEEAYISFANGGHGQHEHYYEKKPVINNYRDQRNQIPICDHDHQFSTTPSLTMSQPAQSASAASSASGICMNQNATDFFAYNSWDIELGSVMEFAHDQFQFPGDYV